LSAAQKCQRISAPFEQKLNFYNFTTKPATCHALRDRRLSLPEVESHPGKLLKVYLTADKKQKKTFHYLLLWICNPAHNLTHGQAPAPTSAG
jgi:hypothetical protein